jgi:tRNA pseudouridine55 synthase
MTSRDVVDRAQAWFPPQTKIGHTGTLDPLATGVLVLCLGEATRLAEYVQRMDKLYEAGMLLGKSSDTDDAEGTIQQHDGPRPEQDRVRCALNDFVGEIEQTPPNYSAAKVRGRRAYDLARRGKFVSLAARRVQIYGIELLKFDFPRLQIRVHCGKGTYIRSLARDLGNRLGCGALVETLQRTRIGPFDITRCIPLESDGALARSSLQPLSAAVVELPRLTVTPGELTRLRHGQAIPFPGEADSSSTRSEGREVAVFDQEAKLCVLAMVREGSVLVPMKVLNAGKES